MNELDLYLLLEEATFELHNNIETDECDVHCFSYLFHFDAVTEALSDYLKQLEEGVFEIKIRNDYFVWSLKPICDYYEIDIVAFAKKLEFN